jgi:uncharacterized protein (TIGR02145 family)
LSNSLDQQLNFILQPEPTEAEREEAAQTGNTLNEVRIGNQIWAAQNLNTAQFSNGEFINEAKTDAEWKKAGDQKQPAWCYYNNDPANGEIYGKLYNWYALADLRGLCPTGWHVPSDAEWTVLTDYLGGPSVAGGKMKSTGTKYWQSTNSEATNESGFMGLPGGYRYNYIGSFSNVGYYGDWWSSTESSTTDAWNRNLYYGFGNAYRNTTNKQNGFSVRCLRD